MYMQYSLTPSQDKALTQRRARRFRAIVGERDLLAKAEAAGSIKELEALMMRYDLCDLCDCTGVDYSAALMLAKAIIKISYRFPQLRCKLCFLGTLGGYTKTMQALSRGDKGLVRQMGLDPICSPKTVADFARDALIMMDNAGYNRTDANVLATAIGMGGFLDALVIDERDFSGMGYTRLCENLRSHELAGNVPGGCGRPVSVIYHECGHLLDYICELSDDHDFLLYFMGLGSEKIKRNVSEYAATTPKEFVAEAFSEYMCSYAPREIARSVYDAILRKFRLN